MPRYLLIANETLGGQDLLDELQRRAGGDTSFHVLVPVSESEHRTGGGVGGRDASSTAPGPYLDTDPTARGELSPTDAARARLDEAIEQIERFGAQAEGDVTTDDPAGAAERAVADGNFDGVIVSTPPPGGSQLLGRDLVSQIEERVNVSVEHIYGPRGDVREAE